jgi:hypothetical protein
MKKLTLRDARKRCVIEKNEALDVLRDAALAYQNWRGTWVRADSDLAELREISEALAALEGARVVVVPEGQHVYTSKFKPGDEVWIVQSYMKRKTKTKPRHEVWCVGDPDEVIGLWFDGVVVARGEGLYDEWTCFHDRINNTNCFPTREEAEAECARRNKEATDDE